MTFISEKFENAITSYLNYVKNNKKLNAFCFSENVINTLILIYGDADILNPYYIKNFESFKNNILKFGLSVEDFNEFIESFNSIPNCKEKNVNYEKIQKLLLKMLAKKINNSPLSDEQITNITNSLYIKKNKDINYYSFALLYFYNLIDDDYEKTINEKNVKITLSSDRDSYLPDAVYEKYGFNPLSVRNLDDDQLTKFNRQIKEEEQKMASENEGGIGRVLSKLPPAVRSGSGFVDALLLSSIIATIILIIFVVYLLFR